MLAERTGIQVTPISSHDAGKGGLKILLFTENISSSKVRPSLREIASRV
jgi:hypothetical protein